MRPTWIDYDIQTERFRDFRREAERERLVRAARPARALARPAGASSLVAAGGGAIGDVLLVLAWRFQRWGCALRSHYVETSTC